MSLIAACMTRNADEAVVGRCARSLFGGGHNGDMQTQSPTDLEAHYWHRSCLLSGGVRHLRVLISKKLYPSGTIRYL